MKWREEIPKENGYYWAKYTCWGAIMIVELIHDEPMFDGDPVAPLLYPFSSDLPCLIEGAEIDNFLFGEKIEEPKE